MPYLDPKLLELERDGGLLTVRSPFWSVTHNLDRGGAVTGIHFAHGQPGNVLRAPFGPVRERTGVRVQRFSDGFALRFARASYRFTPYWIRLEAPGAWRVRLDDRFTHWGGAHDPLTKPGRAAGLLGPHHDQGARAGLDESVPSRRRRHQRRSRRGFVGLG
jgi:hypothetical protein